MDEVKKSKAVPAELGIKIGGSAKQGHDIGLVESEALSAIFGTNEPHQVKAFLNHCLKVLHPDEAGDANASSDQRLFMLSIIRDLAPRDAVERMLAVQMAATHVAITRAGRSLAVSDTLQRAEAHNIGFNKLARTFTAQIEALRKYRSGGEQRVIVQHVNVADGGQAIVGNVNGKRHV